MLRSEDLLAGLVADRGGTADAGAADALDPAAVRGGRRLLGAPSRRFFSGHSTRTDAAGAKRENSASDFQRDEGLLESGCARGGGRWFAQSRRTRSRYDSGMAESSAEVAGDDPATARFQLRPRTRLLSPRNAIRRSRCHRHSRVHRGRSGNGIHLRPERVASFSSGIEEKTAQRIAHPLSGAPRFASARSRGATLSARSRGQSIAGRGLDSHGARVVEARTARAGGGSPVISENSLALCWRGSPANRAFSLGWWNNRAAPSGREFDFERMLNLKWERQDWR